MRPLALAPRGEFAAVRYVLTDMDDTLTFGGRLPAASYDALERLRSGGLKVFVVTAAPAGWCDQMVRMWPVEGVIGENGGFFFRRGGAYGVLRHFWNGHDQRRELFALGKRIVAELPGASLSDDQPFRLATLAFSKPRDAAVHRAILAALRRAGLSSTQNGQWLLGWSGGFDKLAMTRRVLADIDDEAICYCGDAENDVPMFAAFRHSVGMSTVGALSLAHYPNWITDAPGGAGFVEAAGAVLASAGVAAYPPSERTSASSRSFVPRSREPAST